MEGDGGLGGGKGVGIWTGIFLSNKKLLKKKKRKLRELVL